MTSLCKINFFKNILLCGLLFTKNKIFIFFCKFTHKIKDRLLK